MKQFNHIKEIYSGKAGNIYVADNGVHIWDVIIDAGIGEEVLIGHISDIHLNYCNKQDFDEADPVLMSTYQNRMWCANGETVPKLRSCLDILDDADKVVANGDIMDYLSHGCMELIQKEIWEKYSDVITIVGGHEFCIRMQGEVPEVLSYDERVNIIRDFWKDDIYYISSVVKDKVMIVGMNNDLARFNEIQKQKLQSDLELARSKGYAVLIFAHEPFRTGNPAEEAYTEEMALLVGDNGGFPRNFFSGNTRGSIMVGAKECDEITQSVYNIIVNSADVVKAVFTGHYHNDMYTEIAAKTSDGSDSIIPQYTHTATAYDNGHLMRIIIK